VTTDKLAEAREIIYCARITPEQVKEITNMARAERQREGDDRMSKVHGDTNAATDWLIRYAKLIGWPSVCLVALDPDYEGPQDKEPTRRPQAATFVVLDQGGAVRTDAQRAMAEWIEARQGKRNVYFQVNPVRRIMRKKPNRADIARGVALFTDADPDAVTEASKGLAAARERLLKDADGLIERKEVSIIINSGNGLQYIFVLAEPVPLSAQVVKKKGNPTTEPCENTKALAAEGRRLALRFNGDKVQNTDRIFRVPYTVNMPNAKKREKGRMPVLATAYHFSDRRFSRDQLKRLSLPNLDDFPDEALKPRLVDALLQNDDFFKRWMGDTTGLNDKSRSGFAMSITRLLKGRFGKDELRTILEYCPTTAGTTLDDRQMDRMAGKTSNDGPDAHHEGVDETDFEANTATQSQRDKLFALGRTGELWQTIQGEPYATITRNGHKETHHIRSRAYRAYLISEHLGNGGKPVGNTPVSEAITSLEALAMTGPVHDARIRTAEHDGKMYVDLCDDAFNAIEIDAAGWRIVGDAPIKFVRPPGIKALPMPLPGGKIEALREFINLSDDDFKLFVAAMVAAFRPRGPYPALNLVGTAGAAKSSGARVFVRMTDPNDSEISAPPPDEQTLKSAAANSHVLSYDNLSHITGDMLDAFSRMCTGGAFGGRKLYTDQDRAALYACRPMVLTGVLDLATRSDFAQRSITLSLLPIEIYRTEAELWADFATAAPYILGALLDGVANAIRHHREVAETHELPRMADFAAWAAASFPAFGWERAELFHLYFDQARDAARKIADGDRLIQGILTMMNEIGLAWLLDKNDRCDWTGTPTELLKAVREKLIISEMVVGIHTDEDSTLPKGERSLRGRLRRISTTLRELGLVVNPDASVGRGADKRRAIHIAWRRWPA
jgi:hypothetical protein